MRRDDKDMREVVYKHRHYVLQVDQGDDHAQRVIYSPDLHSFNALVYYAKGLDHMLLDHAGYVARDREWTIRPFTTGDIYDTTIRDTLVAGRHER